MSIRFTVLGYEVARIDLTDNQDQTEGGAQAPVMDRVVEKISDWWIGHMLKRHAARA